MLLPFVFDPFLKSVLWGGSRIATYKGWPARSEKIGESWELSAMPGRESVVKAGADRGLLLSQLVEKYGEALLGRRVQALYGDRFPLIVKLIDAHRDLSLQVHPDEALARRLHQASGKTEMWYVVQADPGAAICAGFARDLSPAEYDRHLEDRSIMSVVTRHDSHPGDAFYLPAGCIHALCAGNLVVEVQQASDITYRVYDYDRLDVDGRPRELHTELAREALNFRAAADCFIPYDHASKGSTPLVDGPYFRVNRVVLRGALPIAGGRDAFVALMCVEGRVRLLKADDAVPVLSLQRGETALLPAAAPDLVVEGEATLLQVTV